MAKQRSRQFSFALIFLLITAFTAVAVQRTKTLDIYVVDVEGGNATLVVAPSGESVLLDTGNLNAAARDARRIMAAVRDAGVERIDHLITTHWHLDHFGGVAELARRIPIMEFIDHGPNVQPTPEVDGFLQQTYPNLYRDAIHTVVRAGGKLQVTGIEMTVVSSAGETIHTPLPAAGTPNPYCADFKREPVDRGENAQSIGVHIRFGKFRALHLGDLSTNKEADLMCPDNRIGRVDLFVVSHHGQLHSNNEILVHAIESRVAVMNNGLRKGGEPQVMEVIHSAPGLEDLWQLHFSELSGQEYTVPGMFIANWPDAFQPFVPVAPLPSSKLQQQAMPAPSHNGTAYWIKVSAKADGTFTVTNNRNGFAKTYRVRSERE
jgi:beta-lactamase superfamily II metal-dependent hydrolase